MLQGVIDDKSALRKLAEFVEAQGGDAAPVYDTSLLPQASMQEEVLSMDEGYVVKITCDHVGVASLLLGGGRKTKESTIDLSVGLILHKKLGDYVKKGESIATIYGNDKEQIEQAKTCLLDAYFYASKAPEEIKFIKAVITE